MAVDGVSFDLSAGGVVGLLGPSGSGKTTLIRCLVGVQIVESGSIEVLSEPAGAPGLRRRVGYLTQAPSVYGDLTVRGNLRYFARVLGAPPDDVDRVLAEVDLQRDAESLVGRLSGGQRSRVSLATALLGKPELLILDEPTVGLDPILRRDLWALFRRLAAAGTSLIVSSHVMEEAAHCDLLLLMRDGRLIARETPASLLARTGAGDLEAAFVALIDRGMG